MAGTLQFVQMIYDDSHRVELYDFATPYFNHVLSPYFENDVIQRLVPSMDADYLSVCSWRLWRKRGDVHHWLKNDTTLTKDKILSCDADVGILTPRSPAHRPLYMAVNWHGVNWVEPFNRFKSFIRSLGLAVPDVKEFGDPDLKYTIYENHFVTRKEIYHDYVINYLRPSIHFMDQDPIFMGPSGYNQKKRDRAEIKRIQGILGMQDWPIAPFILERLFAIYCHNKDFKVVTI